LHAFLLEHIAIFLFHLFYCSFLQRSESPVASHFSVLYHTRTWIKIFEILCTLLDSIFHGSPFLSTTPNAPFPQ
jgi:hypothetical protein